MFVMMTNHALCKLSTPIQAPLMLLPRILLSACLSLMALQAHAVELEGHNLAPTIQLSGRSLILNGAAVRRFAIFKVEVASLYLEQRQSSLEAVASDPGAKRLRLVMLRRVSAEDLHKKFMGDLKSVSTAGELSQVKHEIDVLDESLRNVALQPGDVITIDWLPAKGMVTSLNGRALSDSATGTELLYRMVLRIFLGPNAARTPREKLLGLQPISD